MTICICAICKHEGAPALVVAADHMITASFGPYTLEFEHENSKFGFLNKNTVLFFAGDSLFSYELLPKLTPILKETKTVSEISEKVKELTEQERLRRIDEQVFLPRALTRKKFYEEGVAVKLPPQLSALIDQHVQAAKLNVEMLLAGIDASGAHVFQISDKMIKGTYDGIGFSAIGSGAIHAISSLVAQKYTPNCDAYDAIYFVYTAKRKAEAAPGVGNKLTDMRLITDNESKTIDCKKLGDLFDKEQCNLDKFYKDISTKKYGDYLK